MKRPDIGRVVVLGLMGHVPFGGMAWQVIHYLEGLRSAGLDVWYVEDSDQRMLSVDARDWSGDPKANADFVNDQLAARGMADRWILRVPGTRECIGAQSAVGLRGLYQSADLVINLCGSHELQEQHESVRHLVLIETDPGANQVAAARAEPRALDWLSRHHSRVTYATNLAGADCLLPNTGLTWRTSVPPVTLADWATAEAPTNDAFTTVMNWSPPKSVIDWEGRSWAWSKQRAVRELAMVPGRTTARMEVALRKADEATVSELQGNGWSVVPASTLDAPLAYRDYIRSSFGEFSVAKEQYVAPRSGWISDRTVCYLAAGRPAIVERTHIKGIPLGLGLVDFADVDEAAAAIDDVVSNYPRHAAAARELAAEYFAADKVVARMLHDIGFGT